MIISDSAWVVQKQEFSLPARQIRIVPLSIARSLRLQVNNIALNAGLFAIFAVANFALADPPESSEEHWAFIQPEKASLPQPVGVESWARNPIDHFVLERLIQQGLNPNAKADRHALARRAALDIIGLPPGPEMLAAFIERTTASRTGPSGDYAYEEYVDELLHSIHAGEHRARYWLDAARYGDTHGMHVDNYREIWPYRDWVIRAFTDNMPFDQFVTQQLAGDLLPEATLDQLIATGFNRCNITTSEGGAIAEELKVRYMVDRLETTATVFLGLTVGCAVCHDHKYDPISQVECYQLGAFFNNTTQPALDGNQKDSPPVVTLPDGEFLDEWNELQARRDQVRHELRQWNSNASQWWVAHPNEVEHPISTDKLLLWLPLTEGAGEAIELPKSDRWETDHPGGQRGVRFGEGGGLSLDMPQLHSDDPLTISFWLRTPDQLIDVNLMEQPGQIKEEEAEEAKTVGWKIIINARGELSLLLYDRNGNSVHGRVPDNDALLPQTWQHICIRYSGG